MSERKALVCPSCGEADYLEEVWWTASSAPLSEVYETERGTRHFEADYDSGKTYWDAIVNGGIQCGSCNWGMGVVPKLAGDENDIDQLQFAIAKEAE